MHTSKQPTSYGFNWLSLSISAALLIMLCGCASNSPLAGHPITAIFTEAYIPRLPAPTDPSHTYAADAVQTWLAVNRVIQLNHSVIVATNRESGVLTFYTDYSPRFITNHFKNSKDLIKTMSDGKEPLPTFLWSHFDHDAKGKLQASAQGKDSEVDVHLLARQLNNVIYGSSIYDAKVFTKVTLRKETQESLTAPSLG